MRNGRLAAGENFGIYSPGELVASRLVRVLLFLGRDIHVDQPKIWRWDCRSAGQNRRLHWLGAEHGEETTTSTLSRHLLFTCTPLYMELKSSTGRVTENQADVIADLTNLGFPCDIVHCTTMKRGIVVPRVTGKDDQVYSVASNGFR